MQLTLTAHSLARALDVAAAPYRSLTPRPRENDPAAHIVLEATTEGLLCSGHGAYLSARTLADYSLTAPAGLDRMSPAMIPARTVRALAAALTESGGWATVCATRSRSAHAVGGRLAASRRRRRVRGARRASR